MREFIRKSCQLCIVSIFICLPCLVIFLFIPGKSLQKKQTFSLFLSFLLLSFLVGSATPFLGSTRFHAQLGKKAYGVQSRAPSFFNRLPIYFVENRGQWPEPVKYHLRLARMDLFFTPQEIVFHFLQERFKLKFSGANERVNIEGRNKAVAKFNFFKGRNPQKKITGAGTYRKLIYQELYPHIDLIICEERGQIKTEFRVKEGGDPGQITFRYEGVKGININADGQMEVKISTGKIKEEAPFSYQIVNHRRVEVESAYVLDKNNRVKFKLGEYKIDRELIIDPLIYSTFLGSQGYDSLRDFFIDDDGNIFVTGGTEYPDFLQGEDDVNIKYRKDMDAYIVKLNPSASEILFATFLSGIWHDAGEEIAVDGNGNVYVLGHTNSMNFPIISGAYDESYNGGGDLFLIKLDPSGAELLYSTYLGGKQRDLSLGMELIGEGIIVMGGYTFSPDFPVTTGAFDISFNGGNNDSYIAAFDFGGGNLVYSTYVGGTENDAVFDVAVDQNGNVYITGITESPDFPVTPGAFKTSKGNPQNAFVTKINAAGSDIVYSTYLGGNDERETYTLQSGQGITVDKEGYAYVTGSTDCRDFPTTPGAFDTEHSGGRDVFVVKLNPSGSELVFSTLLGGVPSIRRGDTGIQVKVDTVGNVYVTGHTGAADFPTTPNAISLELGGIDDAFVTVFNSTGTGIIYSTYLGGTAVYSKEVDSPGPGGGSDIEEGGLKLFVDKRGDIYVAGETYSYDFPISPNAVDPIYGGNRDVFLCKISTDSHAPFNFKGQKEMVRSLLQSQYVIFLSWEPNPMIENVVQYRIYQGIDRERLFLGEVSADVLSYWHKGVEKNKVYRYALVAVDEENRESAAAILSVK